MQSTLSRRGVVAGIAVAPMLPTQVVQKEADAELAALGEQFTATVELLFSDSDWTSNKALLSRLEEIGQEIMDTPATTMSGLVVKARVACFVQGSGLWFWVDPNHERVGYLWFPKIRSGRIRAVRQNQRIIRCDACDRPPTWNVCRQPVQVAAPA
jgi:hypothetical protein